MTKSSECDICNGNADSLFKRKIIWSNKRWNLSLSKYFAVKGFAYLEPVEHVDSLDKLDEELSKEFGVLLVKFTRILKEVFKVKLVYVYIFGDHISHLHVHLAPHSDGDFLFSEIVKPDVSFPEDLLNESEFNNLANRIQELVS